MKSHPPEQPVVLVMTSKGFFYFVAIFELYLLYSHHMIDALRENVEINPPS
jgi:hypothetical protein